MRSVWCTVTGLILRSLLHHAPSTRAALVNVTVDDDGTDPSTGSTITYSPADSWSTGQTCNGCLAQPNPSIAFDGTWHDSTYSFGEPVTSATFQFQGSALYVYCILAPVIEFASTDSYMSFSIDGKVVGTFIQSPTQVQDYTSTLVFHTTSISDAAHTFVLQNGNSNTQINNTLMLFDFLVYSHDDASSSPPPTSPRPPPPVTSAPTPASQAPHSDPTIPTSSSAGTGSQLNTAHTQSTQSTNSADTQIHSTTASGGPLQATPSAGSSSPSTATGSSPVLLPTPTTSSANAINGASRNGVSISVLIPVVIAAVVFSILLVLGILWWRNRRRATRHAIYEEATYVPYIIPEIVETPTVMPVSKDAWLSAPPQEVHPESEPPGTSTGTGTVLGSPGTVRQPEPSPGGTSSPAEPAAQGSATLSRRSTMFGFGSILSWQSDRPPSYHEAMRSPSRRQTGT